jgi:hypothetical protein
MKAKALEAAAAHFVGTGDRGQARAAVASAVEVYASLGAAADIARLQATFCATAFGAGRTPSTGRRRAADSPNV